MAAARRGAVSRYAGMSGFFDVYSIIFLIIAVVIFMRLGSVLGRRTGNEPSPYETRVKPPRRARATTTSWRCRRATAAARRRPSAPDLQPLSRYAAPGTPLYDGLVAITKAVAGFRSRAFPDRRQGRLRDDRHGLCAGRPRDAEEPSRARRLRRLRRRDRRAGEEGAEGGADLRRHRGGEDHGGRARRPDGAHLAPLRRRADQLHARQGRQGGRRRRDRGADDPRRLDLCARRRARAIRTGSSSPPKRSDRRRPRCRHDRGRASRARHADADHPILAADSLFRHCRLARRRSRRGASARSWPARG